MDTKDKNINYKNPRSRLESDIIRYLSSEIRGILYKVGVDKLSEIEEIRLRADKPIVLQNCYNEWFVDIDGNLTKTKDSLFTVKQTEIAKTLELMSNNSIYAYQDEIKSGFITLKGGHRIGITGKVVLDRYGVKNIKYISGLNIRQSNEIQGCSEKLIKYIINNNNEVYNTLVISPPQCGKTTILRDMARILSDGIYKNNLKGFKICIVDERSEIAACYMGIPQNQVGIRTDVLDGCPKSLGMTMVIRSMSPQIIITDEIGNEGDKEAIMKVLNAGVKIITTAHGYNISELKSRLEVVSLIEQKVFDRYIVLSNLDGPGTLEEVLDGQTLSVIYRRCV